MISSPILKNFLSCAKKSQFVIALLSSFLYLWMQYRPSVVGQMTLHATGGHLPIWLSVLHSRYLDLLDSSVTLSLWFMICNASCKKSIHHVNSQVVRDTLQLFFFKVRRKKQFYRLAFPTATKHGRVKI